MLILTALVGSHHNIQLCCTARNGKSPALTSFPLCTETDWNFSPLLWTEEARHSVNLLLFCLFLNGRIYSPSKYSYGLILQGTEQSLLCSTTPALLMVQHGSKNKHLDNWTHFVNKVHVKLRWSCSAKQGSDQDASLHFCLETCRTEAAQIAKQLPIRAQDLYGLLSSS